MLLCAVCGFILGVQEFQVVYVKMPFHISLVLKLQFGLAVTARASRVYPTRHREIKLVPRLFCLRKAPGYRTLLPGQFFSFTWASAAEENWNWNCLARRTNRH